MTTHRFPWSRVSKLDGALELKARKVTPTLELDSGLECWACGKECKAGQKVYRPSKNCNTISNKVIGHVKCIDDMCAGIKAQGAKEAIKAAERRNVILPGGQAELGKSLDVNKSLVESDKKNYEAGYAAGYTAGREAVLAELMAAVEQI